MIQDKTNDIENGQKSLEVKFQDEISGPISKHDKIVESGFLDIYQHLKTIVFDINELSAKTDDLEKSKINIEEKLDKTNYDAIESKDNFTLSITKLQDKLSIMIQKRRRAF